MATLLDLKNVVKTYGKGEAAFTALKGIHLQINEGEVVAIIGKSGSGKSTLMHLMALLDTPTEGKIIVNGIDTHSLHRKKVDELRNQQFGFVFQQFFLNANDTVLENVTLPLKIAGTSAKMRHEMGMSVLEAVELSDKANTKASKLSGGQKQRVAIARALINNPKVIFADEPTGNLDSVTGQKIEDLLFNLHKKRGITLLFVTHDHELAARCKRKIYIKDGTIAKGKD